MTNFNITNETKQIWTDTDKQLVQMMYAIAIDVRTSVADFRKVLEVTEEENLNSLHKFFDTYLNQIKMTGTDFEDLVRNFVKDVQPYQFIDEARELLTYIVEYDYSRNLQNNIMALLTIILDAYGHGHLVGVNSAIKEVIFDKQPTTTTFIAVYLNKIYNVKGYKSVFHKGLNYGRTEVRRLRRYVESFDLISLMGETETNMLRVINHRDQSKVVEMVSTVSLVNSTLNANAMFFEFDEEQLNNNSSLAYHSLLAYNSKVDHIRLGKEQNIDSDFATNCVFASLANDELCNRNAIPPSTGMSYYPESNNLGVLAVHYNEMNADIHERIFGVVETLDGRRIPFSVDTTNNNSILYQLLTIEQLFAFGLIMEYNGVTGNYGIEQTGFKFKSRLDKLSESEEYRVYSISLLTAQPFEGDDYEPNFKPIEPSRSPLFVVKDKGYEPVYLGDKGLYFGKNEVVINPTLTEVIVKDKSKSKDKGKKKAKKLKKELA